MRWVAEQGTGRGIREQHIDILLSRPEQASTRLRNAVGEVLDEEERQRALRFVFDRDRDLYIFSHGLLRLVLARYLGVDPRELCFALAKGGRPELAWPSSTPIRFNLSHTKGLVACIVTSRADCGVDVERIDRVDYRRLVPSVLATEELSALMRLTEECRRHRFFEIWTLKEAYLKGRGLGISYPVRNISFSGFDGTRRCLVTADSEDDGSAWRFWSKTLTHTHSAAAAVRTTGNDISFSLISAEDLP
ncbi:4'-phosphopantetheinyl transferase superfamily protein [Bradyrhizobium sp. ISRA442]|uniref:4'-phosphopantetheinyl transferase family protein n=1 Tax=Bradyrhizobium sp. ISRA442 TaxID=2866197 RepID=UPI00311AE082